MFDDGGFMCKVDTISNFRVPKPSKIIKQKFEILLDKIINNKDNQNQIELLNIMVCKLYNLTYSEFMIINENAKINQQYYDEYLINL
jgi:hypothetical protein